MKSAVIYSGKKLAVKVVTEVEVVRGGEVSRDDG